MKTPLAETFPSFKDSIRNAADIDAAIDFKASFDSLEIMEGVTRHFFLRALIDESMGSQTDWNAVDSLMQGSGGGGEGCPLSSRATVRDQARRRHKRQGDGWRLPRRSTGQDQGGVGEAQADPRADYRIGGCGRAAGLRTRQHIRSRRLVWKPQRPLDGTRA
jgi:hypothetical protein